MIRRRILFGGLLVVLFVLGWWVGRGRATTDLYENLDLFVEVLDRVEENYVSAVEPAKLIRGALNGMLRTLDPYSQYLDEREYASLQTATQGRFNGVGIVVSVRDHFPTVISPIEGSPAWEAGMQSGDVIVRVDGASCADFSVDDAAAALRGPEGSHVRVTVRREGDPDEHTFDITRREIVTKSVPYAFVLAGDIGYLRLAGFSEHSGREVRDALGRLRASGARRLILDMRRNPGGLLDQAVDVSEQFLPGGATVVETRGRLKRQEGHYEADAARSETGWPMVVVIDEGSASAAEIVAGALQDYDRALVVGTTSFGKGSVQSVFPVRAQNAAVKLTTALYYTPSGRSIHKSTGEAPSNADDTDTDAGDEAPAPHGAAAADSAGRPAFKTKGGRIVYGGGGITPDVPVAADSLPAAAAAFERRGLPLRLAARLEAERATGAGAPSAAERWKALVGFARSESLGAGDAALAAARPVLDRALRRELARRARGDSAAARVALEGDPVVARAVDILRAARTAGEVFSEAGVAAPGRPAPRPRGAAATRRNTRGGARTPSPSPVEGPR